MSDVGETIAPLVERLDQLMARIAPVERRALAREVARDLRRANALRQRANIEPDGAAMVARKPKERKLRSGKTRRITGAAKAGTRMFRKASKSMRSEATEAGVVIAFRGAAERIFTVHQYGGVDRVGGAGSAIVAYAPRQVLGMSAEDRVRIREAVLARLG